VFVVVPQVCLLLLLTITVTLLSRYPLHTHQGTSTSVLLVNVTSRDDEKHNSTWASADWRLVADDSRWYNFSRPPLFAFYVYSAFLVEEKTRDVIRLVSITSIVEQFAGQKTDVLCVVRYPGRTRPHVASILHRVPKVITQPDHVGRNAVADYVYSCPLPVHQQQQHIVPVSTR